MRGSQTEGRFWCVTSGRSGWLRLPFALSVGRAPFRFGAEIKALSLSALARQGRGRYGAPQMTARTKAEASAIAEVEGQRPAASRGSESDVVLVVYGAVESVFYGTYLTKSDIS